MKNTVYFSQINKEINVEKLAEILSLNPNDIAFIGGSLVEGSINDMSKGMGNRLSDIDVFILKNKDSLADVKCSDNLDYNSNNMIVKFYSFDGISIDTEIHSLEIINDIIKQLNAIDFNNCEDTKRLKNWIKTPKNFDLKKFLSFLHRLYYSIPIFNEVGYNEFKNSINFDNYFKYMSLFYISKLDVRYEDVIGNIESQQYIVAVEGAREILRYTMLSYLFSKKQSLDREKWIPLRMKNIASQDNASAKIFKRYYSLMFGSVMNSDSEFKNNAEEILDFSNYVIRQIKKLM